MQTRKGHRRTHAPAAFKTASEPTCGDIGLVGLRQCPHHAFPAHEETPT